MLHLGMDGSVSGTCSHCDSQLPESMTKQFEAEYKPTSPWHTATGPLEDGLWWWKTPDNKIHLIRAYSGNKYIVDSISVGYVPVTHWANDGQWAPATPPEG